MQKNRWRCPPPAAASRPLTDSRPTAIGSACAGCQAAVSGVQPDPRHRTNRVLWSSRASAGRPRSRRWIRVCCRQGPGRHPAPAGAHARARPKTPTRATVLPGSAAPARAEPIRVTGQLTDRAVQAVVKTEYFPDQLTVFPRDGDTVTAGDVQLTWHAVDASRTTSTSITSLRARETDVWNVLFWAVTVVSAPREMPGVRRAIG